MVKSRLNKKDNKYYENLIDRCLIGTEWAEHDYFKYFLYDNAIPIVNIAMLLSGNDTKVDDGDIKNSLRTLVHLLSDAYQAGIDDYERWLMDGDEDAEY